MHGECYQVTPQESTHKISKKQGSSSFGPFTPIWKSFGSRISWLLLHTWPRESVTPNLSLSWLEILCLADLSSHRASSWGRKIARAAKSSHHGTGKFRSFYIQWQLEFRGPSRKYRSETARLRANRGGRGHVGHRHANQRCDLPMELHSSSFLHIHNSYHNRWILLSISGSISRTNFMFFRPRARSIKLVSRLSPS